MRQGKGECLAVSKRQTEQHSAEKENDYSGALKLHLRLKAASGLLKMAQHAKYDKELSNADYETIAMTCQVSQERLPPSSTKLLTSCRVFTGLGICSSCSVFEQAQQSASPLPYNSEMVHGSDGQRCGS